MTRTGDEAAAPDPALGPILACLGGEIRRPLEALRGRIDHLLAESSTAITEAERVQARTILGLCDDLGRLTKQCLDRAGLPAED